jgi:hypothetical protein
VVGHDLVGPGHGVHAARGGQALHVGHHLVAGPLLVALHGVGDGARAVDGAARCVELQDQPVGVLGPQRVDGVSDVVAVGRAAEGNAVARPAQDDPGDRDGDQPRPGSRLTPDRLRHRTAGLALPAARREPDEGQHHDHDQPQADRAQRQAGTQARPQAEAEAAPEGTVLTRERCRQGTPDGRRRVGCRLLGAHVGPSRSRDSEARRYPSRSAAGRHRAVPRRAP